MTIAPLTPEQRRQLTEDAREQREEMPEEDLPTDLNSPEDADDAEARDAST